jgi:hypothetical protein
MTISTDEPQPAQPHYLSLDGPIWITWLAGMKVEPVESLREFLGRLVSAMAAVCGAVWTARDGQGPALQCQVDLERTGLEEARNTSRLATPSFS